MYVAIGGPEARSRTAEAIQACTVNMRARSSHMFSIDPQATVAGIADKKPLSSRPAMTGIRCSWPAPMIKHNTAKPNVDET